jgi:hypothetical protein
MTVSKNLVRAVSPPLKRVKVAITASKNASLGDFDIKMAGHPLKGAEASNEFKLTVVKE